MTILNGIVLPDRVGLLSDTSVSAAGAGPTITSKALALPGLGLLVGAAGSLEVLQAAVRMLLNGLPPGSTVADVAVSPGPAPAAPWQRTQRAPSSVIVAGIVGEELQAYILSSPAFDAVRMPPGVWLLPPTRPAAERRPAESVDVTDSAPGDVDAPAVLRQPVQWALDWTESLEVAQAAVRTNGEQRRVQSAGPLGLLVLARFTGPTATRLDALDFLEAAEP